MVVQDAAVLSEEAAMLIWDAAMSPCNAAVMRRKFEIRRNICAPVEQYKSSHIFPSPIEHDIQRINLQRQIPTWGFDFLIKLVEGRPTGWQI
jgi:hypothetical protein